MQRGGGYPVKEQKIVVKNVDMVDEMANEAQDLVLEAMRKFDVEKDIASFIKKEFDKRHDTTWHCVVGRNFGSFVTHESKHFIYLYCGQTAVLLFKSG